MKLKMITAPTTMPVTTEEAKGFFRIIGSDEDAEIIRAVKMATEQAENITNRQLCAATYEGYLDSFVSSVKIPKPPLVSVLGVEYIDTDGIIQIWTDYYIDTIAEPAVLYFDSFPSDVKTDGVNNVIITFVCGYDEVPASIQSYILNNALTRFENRENEVIASSVDSSISENVKRLLDSYRVIPV